MKVNYRNVGDAAAASRLLIVMGYGRSYSINSPLIPWEEVHCEWYD